MILQLVGVFCSIQGIKSNIGAVSFLINIINMPSKDSDGTGSFLACFLACIQRGTKNGTKELSRKVQSKNSSPEYGLDADILQEVYNEWKRVDIRQSMFMEQEGPTLNGNGFIYTQIYIFWVRGRWVTKLTSRTVETHVNLKRAH